MGISTPVNITRGDRMALENTPGKTITITKEASPTDLDTVKGTGKKTRILIKVSFT